MRNVNKVILLGNLTRDPEMRRTLSEQYVTTFGMATNREWVTKDMRKQQDAQFHELVCWGRLAEIASTHLKKGHLIYVEGYLKTRSWDDASGVKKFRTEVVVEDLIMLEKRPNTPSLSEAKQLAPRFSGASSSDALSSSDAIPNEAPAEDLSIATESQPSISIEDPFTI